MIENVLSLDLSRNTLQCASLSVWKLLGLFLVCVSFDAQLELRSSSLERVPTTQFSIFEKCLHGEKLQMAKTDSA